MSICALFLAPSAAAQNFEEIFRPGEIEDPAQDPVNNDVSANSLVALFMRLEISGDDATARDIELMRIPLSQANFSINPSNIVFEVFNEDSFLVGQTSVADRRMVARNGATLRLKNRSVSVIVPLIAKPREVLITLPGVSVQQQVIVEAVVRDFCRSFGSDPVCSDDPPRSSPFFNLLHPLDP